MKGIDKIIELLKSKASVKQDVFAHGKIAFGQLKESAKNLIAPCANKRWLMRIKGMVLIIVGKLENVIH